jgi:hypothetical protein
MLADQLRAHKTVLSAIAMASVAQDGVTDMGQMTPQLVSAPRQRLQF